MSEPIADAPFLHRRARRLGMRGWRGARIYWGIAHNLVRFPTSHIVRVDPDLVIPFDASDWISRNAYRGLYERAEIEILRRLLDEGDVVVDVGANVGYVSAIAKSMVGVHGRVLSFEPSPRCLLYLHALAEASGIEVFPNALGAEEAVAFLTGHDTRGHSGLGTLRENSEAGHPVRVQRLGDALADAGATEVALCKIDVEGLEGEVLRGAGDLLSAGKARSALIEVTPEFGSTAFAADLISDVEDSYSAYVVSERGWLRRVAFLLPVGSADIAKQPTQFNLLLLRSDATGRVRDLVEPKSSR